MSPRDRISLLRQIKLFQALSRDEIEALCSRIVMRELPGGTPIVEEGERGDSLFVIASGAVLVYTLTDGQELPLARLERGDFFGEQALLPDGTQRRNASVRALGPVSLLEVTRADFAAVLTRDQVLARRLRAEGEDQLRHRLAQQSALFRALAPSDLLDTLREDRYEDGAIVFHYGEPGDRFYLVLDGVARVTRPAPAAPGPRGGRPGEELVALLQPGQCFGEMALISRTPRSATVSAQGPLRTLSMSGETFLSYYERSPELRQALETLQHIYRLPGQGVVTLHAGTLLDEECVTSLYHLQSGAQVAARRVIGRPLYNVSVVGAATPDVLSTARYEQRSAHVFRELTLDQGHILEATVQGEWADLDELQRMVLEQQRLQPWQLAVFLQRGDLRLERRASSSEDSAEIVCTCARVTRGALRQAYASGCRSVELLAARTGASLVCGVCRPQLAEMAGRSDFEPVEILEILPITPEIRSFRLRPYGKPISPPQPGQYIVVQAFIHGRWVQRAYTLSSAASEQAYYEITVQREPHGLMSGWLFERSATAPAQDTVLRVSMPRGEFCLALGRPGKSVFFAGGIGITPALAFARTIVQAGLKQSLYIDYSAHSRQGLAFAAELEAYARNHPSLQVTLRATAETGRLTEADVAAALGNTPGAVVAVFVCGSRGYQQAVLGHLGRAGVPAERIHVETFTHASSAS